MLRRFIAVSVVLVPLFFAIPAYSQNVAGRKAKATTPEIPFESVANFFKLPAGLYMGEGVGVATNSKGPRLRVHAQRRDAAVRVRSERRVREGVRRRQLRLLVRARGARRQGRQRLGRRRGHQRHPEVQPRRQAADGARQAARIRSSSSRSRRAADSTRARTGRTRSTARPTSAGIRRATSSSPTATATRAS